MVAKLCTLILAAGLCAVMLLATRQQRLAAVHEMAMIQRRIHEHDRELYRQRIEIARRVLPQRVEALAAALGPLAPLGVDAVAALPVTALATRAGQPDADATPPTPDDAPAGGGVLPARFDDQPDPPRR